MHTGVFFSGDKAARSWSSPLMTTLYRGKDPERVTLFPHTIWCGA
jgi:hypothetical protein